MGYFPVTSFRRPLTAARITAVSDMATPRDGQQPADKWDLLRDLALVRAQYQLTDRDLAVLNALLSFLPGTTLEENANLVVYASNATICERLNQMPCSTMRRHLAALVRSGLVLRKDSPNAKRYQRASGDGVVAFGLDLRPLLQNVARLQSQAEAARAEARDLRSLRETVSLMRRDLIGILHYNEGPAPGDAQQAQAEQMLETSARVLRRKPVKADLLQLQADLQDLLQDLIPAMTEKMSTTDAETEQHQQNTIINTYELNSAENLTIPVAVDNSKSDAEMLKTLQVSTLTSHCPQLQSFSPDPLRAWPDVLQLSERLAPMMGINRATWQRAKTAMGPAQAAVVLSSMLERMAQIRSPGAYLQRLCAKALAGQFHCLPMLRALPLTSGSQL